MKFLLISLFNESCLGLRSMGAALQEAGNEISFLHARPFLYQEIRYDQTERISELVRDYPFLARDVGALGDVFVWAHPLPDEEIALLLDHLARIRPDAVGISVSFGRDIVAGQISAAIRRRFPKITIIWGGPHATFCPDASLDYADIVCIGAGEKPLVEWARDPLRADVPGLWLRHRGAIIRNEPEAPPLLENLPMPLYGHSECTLLEGRLSPRAEKDPELIGRIYVFMSSRGCRFDCSYCLSGRMRRISKQPIQNRKSVDSFISEISMAAQRFSLPSPIIFWDDIFTEDIEWMEEFARRYPREIGIPFACQTHYRFCSPRVIELLLEAGVHEVAIGLESGSRRVLRDVYGRSPNVNQVIEQAHQLRDAGLPSLQIDLITNNPFDTEDDCRETLESLLRCPTPFHLEAAKLVIYPGSRLAGYSAKPGGLTERDFDFWNMLYLLTQFKAIPRDDIRAISKNKALRKNPEPLRRMAHEAAETISSASDDDHSRIELRGRESACTDVLRKQPIGFIGKVLLVGAGPLPKSDSTMLCSYNFRTAQLALLLQEQGIPTEVIGVDLFDGADGDAEIRDSLAGRYLRIPESEHGFTILCDQIEEIQPRAILATSAVAAAMVCRADPAAPIWADMPGWLMSEAQLKANVSNNDDVLDRYLELERTVIQRADRISVVCDNQVRVTTGELGILRRLSRRTLDYRFVHRMPMIAHDWRPWMENPSGIRITPQLPDEARVILWSGSLNLWTDIELLFGLIRQLFEHIPQLHFVLTGGRIPGYNQEVCDKFEHMIRTAAFGNRCHLLGWLPFQEVIAWHQRADLGLCVDGARLEAEYGSRTRLVDMLAHGLPAAATRGTELVSQLEQAGAIFPLELSQPESWPEQLNELLASPPKLDALRLCGQRFVLSEYGAEAVSGELLEWLRNPSPAPDNEHRKTIQSSSVLLRSDTIDAQLRQARPMVTWQPQAEIVATARRNLIPQSNRRIARLARLLVRAGLKMSITRLFILIAWSMASRHARSNRLPFWQSWIETHRPSSARNGMQERLVSKAAQRVYGAAMADGSRLGILKSVNILLAHHERDKAGELSCRPQRIEIEPSSLCNIRCRMCPLPHMDNKGANMTQELFSKAEKLFPQAALVEFIGRGEPTLNPHLPQFIEKAVRNDCYVRMFTNGVRLTPELSKRFVRLGVDEIVLSLVAGTAGAYERITERDHYHTVVDNFRALNRIKQRMSSNTPAVSISATLLQGSYESAPDIVRTAANLGVFSVFFGAAYIVIPEMESESLLCQERRDVERVFDECRQVAEQTGVSIVLPSLDSQGESCPPISNNRFGCLHPWLSVLIRAEGDVEVCSYNRKIVGNLHRETLEEIWNGKQFEQFRKGVVRHNGVDYCDICYHRAFRSRKSSRATHFPYGITFDGYQ
jgi:anaerobic magnesium-protoporphyrin IX monomethyl ester cyclase